MNRIQTACYCLLASAFILTGMLVVRTAGLWESTAQAEMVDSKGAATVLTAEVNNKTEALFVLDSKNETLLAYQFDPNRKQNILLAKMDLKATIEAGLPKDKKGK